MDLHFSLEQMARLREDAHLLAVQAAAHERALQALLANAELGLQNGALEHDARQREAVTIASQLCLDARAHQVTIMRVVVDLGADPAEGRPHPAVVLVADDYPDSRAWLSVMLRGAGFMVHTAANGLEAVIAAHQLRPAVILMDIGMPVLDGIEATRLIKAIDELRAARVIAYTAKPLAQPQLHDELFSAVLPKPSSPAEILAAVQRYAHLPA
jgi:CheY-like chemotaxis protein